MNGISRRAFIGGLGAAAALTLSGCAGAGPRPLAMACGERGGYYLEFGELLRDALQRGDRATLRLIPSRGSAENLTLLDDRTADLAIALADSADAHPRAMVAIGRVYQNYLHCVVRADSAVRSLGDLTGARVSVGARGSGAALTARRILATASGSTASAPIRTVELPLGSALTALADGGIAALFWSGGIPTPEIDRVRATLPLRLLDLTPALAALDPEESARYLSARVPAGAYGIAAPTDTVGIPNLLLARADLPDAVAAAVVDTLIDDARELVPSGSLGIQYLTPAALIDTNPVPLHEAARRRYRERYG